jgi:hypothetical protein
MGSGSQPAYTVDTARWPLVVVTPTAAVKDPAALEPTYVKLEAALARQEPFVVMLDMRGGASDPARRKRFTAWVERNDGNIRRYVLANAVIVGSAIERGFVTATTWVLGNPYVVKVFSDARSAEAWLSDVLERHAGQSAGSRT